jgi:hypothetical protein
MSAGKYSFTIEQGATLDFEIQYRDGNGNPINLTGYTGKMEIRSSYSGRVGEFNTIIAPIREMVGDTMIVKVTHTDSRKYQIIKIVLE